MRRMLCYFADQLGDLVPFVLAARVIQSIDIALRFLCFSALTKHTGLEQVRMNTGAIAEFEEGGKLGAYRSCSTHLVLRQMERSDPSIT
jgi:hypothetical protein